MTEASLSKSPFVGAGELRPDRSVRAIAPAEVDRILSAHRLYLKTARKQGARADLSGLDLSGRSSSA